MKLTYAKYNLVIELSESKPSVLIIENPQNMAEFMQELYNQHCGLIEKFVLSEEDKILKLNKIADMVIEPYSLDLNRKNIINGLYSYMNDIANDCIEESEVLNTNIQLVIDKITDNVPYNNITHQFDFNWTDMFKLYGVKIDSDYQTIIEKLVEYIKICSFICKYKLIIFVNLKTYLSDEEIEELYKISNYCKISLLLIESREKDWNGDEMEYIIDKDQCLIVK